MFAVVSSFLARSNRSLWKGIIVIMFGMPAHHISLASTSATYMKIGLPPLNYHLMLVKVCLLFLDALHVSDIPRTRRSFVRVDSCTFWCLRVNKILVFSYWWQSLRLTRYTCIYKSHRASDHYLYSITKTNNTFNNLNNLYVEWNCKLINHVSTL